MRILHTSDWHIGKRLSDRERLPEQAEALDEIAEICEKESVELVLVAGDVFDTFTPPAEAEELFYTKIKKIAGEDRAVVIVSGNHDDGVRLSAAAPFAGEAGVYLFGNKPKRIFLEKNRKIRAVAAGDFASFRWDSRTLRSRKANTAPRRFVPRHRSSYNGHNIRNGPP